MNRRRMTGHRVASATPPEGPQNEIQTVRIVNFTTAPADSFFGISWQLPNAEGIGGGPAGSFSASTPAEQLRSEFETSINSQFPGTVGYPGGEVAITQQMDGNDLVFTVEFLGDLANTNIDTGTASDWGEIAEPQIATVQDGHA